MGKEKMWCRSCQEYHEIDNDVPLNKQLAGHTWGKGDTLRRMTDEDYIEAELDKKISRLNL